MEKYCYLNGRILPFDQASLKLNDIGVLRDYGVFEFLLTYNGRPFLLNKRLARFKRSAKILDLKIPINQKELARVIKQLLLKNGFKESEVRIVLTGGPTPDGMSYHHPTLFILVNPANLPPETIYQKGIKLITKEHQREFPLAKTTNYVKAVRWQKEKIKQKAFEILYTSNGFILEATTSNFFIFKNNVLITPKDNILIGTTRNFVIRLAQPKFKIQKRALKIKELSSATEAFITASNKEIVPVIKIDNLKIGNGKVGERTKYLIKLFREYISKF